MKPLSKIPFFCVLLPICCMLHLVVIVGCEQGDARSIENQLQPRPVKAIQLEAPLTQRHLTFPGTAKAARDVDLSFRVGGPLIELDVETGQSVSRDEIIARIDPRDFQVRVRTMEARLTASRATLEEAELQFQRYSGLIQENAAAKATYDKVKAAFEIARAQVDADVKNLEDARNALNDTVQRAPFTGYIHNEYVENHETVAVGQPIVSLVDCASIEVEVALPEDCLPVVGRFKAFTCRFDALSGAVFPATFKEIGKKPNPSNRSYPLTLTLAPTDDTEALVRPGMAAEVTITMTSDSNAGTFIVPPTAVANDHNRTSYVWVVDTAQQSVVRRPVSLDGLTERGLVILGDLHPGQWVVTAGVNSLTEHQPVRLLTAPSVTNIGREH